MRIKKRAAPDDNGAARVMGREDFQLSNTLEIAGVPDDSGGAAYGFHLLPPADIAFPDSGSRCIQTNM
ncbi:MULTISPECIES: hypothetical protein [Paenibacillus]|uniref:hypothetical protein n=1 Tax=Paenibacillus TaxID=44249 RepID=UPI0011A84F6A|nr:hypothetical protein [Paenibacillus sp. IHBB 10380]